MLQLMDKQKKRHAVQPKLKLGQPGDKYEQEADAVADRVMSMSDSNQIQMQPIEEEEEMMQMQPMEEEEEWVQPKLRMQPIEEEEEELMPKLRMQPIEEEEEMMQTKIQMQPIEEEEAVQPKIQKQPNEEEEEDEKLIQAKEMPGQTPEVSNELEGTINSLRGGGQPLSSSDRGFFEPRFCQGFSQVRIHTNDKAANVARSINARAFTLGENIVFGSGQYSPGTGKGRHLLAHELTHVVQQAGSVPLQTKRLDEPTTSGSMRSMARIYLERDPDKEKKESDLSPLYVQRTIGDGHDFPPASRFALNVILEGIFDNQRVVESGSSGTHVTLVQQALVGLAYELPRFGADGQFGDETKRAVEAFQIDVGLGVDGRVGFRTIDFLDKRDRGAEVAPPARPVVANTPFNTANAIAQPGAAPSIPLGPLDWGFTYPENVRVTIDVFNNAGVWQPVLTGVTGNYSLQNRLLLGVTEVTGPGGNTTAANYCAQINDLNRLTRAAGAWFMRSAVLAHERVHARQFRAALIHPTVIAPLEAAIEAITTPVTAFASTALVAEILIRLDPRFNAAFTAAHANWLARILVLVAGDHTPGGRTDTAEHSIVDPMRRRICRHARTNGWAACPPLCP